MSMPPDTPEGRKASAQQALRDEAVSASLQMEQELAAAQRMALEFEQQVQALGGRVAARLEGEISMLASTVASLLQTLASRLADKDPQLGELARMGLRSSQSLQDEVKAMLSELRQADPDVIGLVESLDRLTRQWRDRTPAVRFEFLSDPPEGQAFGFPDNPIEAFVQRVAEAAVDRAVNLGGARLVVISISRDDEQFRLQVIDDGGPPPASPGHHWRSLQEKAAAMGGLLSLEQADSGGGEAMLKLAWGRAA